MTMQGRTLLQAGSALALATSAQGSAAQGLALPPFDPVPAMPAAPTPGRPGDFDFLSGHWRIQHWRLGQEGWDHFEGEASCWSILGGVCSVEELRIPARGFNGMGLRVLDVEQQVWSDHWVNAKSGVVTAPGQAGSFEQGVGIFSSVDESTGQALRWTGLWDQITPHSCRWRQVSSADDGKSWKHDWIMHWQRV